MPGSPRAARRSWVWLTSIWSPSGCLVVVIAATDVAVMDRIGVRFGIGHEGLVEAGLEDGGDRAIAGRSDDEAAATGRFEGVRAIGSGERQDAEAGPEALFRMRLRPHDCLRQRGRGGADLFGGGEHAVRRPEGVPAVRARHVLG